MWFKGHYTCDGFFEPICDFDDDFDDDYDSDDVSDDGIQCEVIEDISLEEALAKLFHGGWLNIIDSEDDDEL